MLFADPKAGKSIIAQQLASCIAGNHDFLGFTASPEANRVLYVAGEGDIEELQERGQAMGKLFTVPQDRLWYWPMPLAAMNVDKGFAQLMEFAAIVKPHLTIFDPIYALIIGSMVKDEPSGDFVRNMNKYQYLTGSAVLLLHHSHRPVKDEGGRFMEQGAESYFGSFVWKAWPRSFWMLQAEDNEHHYVKLSCAVQRSRKNRLGVTKMVMVEPDPLYFEPRDQNVGPTQAIIMAQLRLHPNQTTSDLVQTTSRGSTMVAEVLTGLASRGMVKGEGYPQKFIVQE